MSIYILRNLNKVLKKSIPRDLNPQMLVLKTSVFTFSPKIEVTLFDCFRIFIIKLMALGVGFEPTVRFHVRLISSQVL